MDEASGGWEAWSWDESLFAGAAGYYEQGRLPYAPGLAAAFASSLALDGQGRLLDVGCGPGTVTLRLAPLFGEAVGLDPDPEMLAHASRAAARRDAGNVTWACQRAEALPAGLGSFRVVTFAASFHWMDRPRVASAVATMLDPGGAVVQVDAPGYRADELAAEARRGTLPFPPPPDDALDQLRRQYLGSDRRAGQGIRNTSPSGEDQVFQNAGFLPARTVIVPDQRAVERTSDDIVASVFSISSTAPHLFGDRSQDFEADMREILAQASPSGRFSLRLPDNILRIWRLPDLPAGWRPSAYVDVVRVSAYADVMEPVRDIAEDAASTDPDVGLRAVAALRALTERLEILQVDNARKLGWSWQQIAARLGVTKQTVHRKHGKRTGRQP